MASIVTSRVTPQSFSFYSIGYIGLTTILIVTSIVTLKVSSLYNIGHNKCRELLSTKVQFRMDKNPTCTRITYVSIEKKGLLACLRRML
jgi:hypothetical protein